MHIRESMGDVERKMLTLMPAGEYSIPQLRSLLETALVMRKSGNDPAALAHLHRLLECVLISLPTPHKHNRGPVTELDLNTLLLQGNAQLLKAVCTQDTSVSQVRSST
jgi:hypothetical protein